MKWSQRLIVAALFVMMAVPQSHAGVMIDLPGGYLNILSSDTGPAMMNQCSRSAPKPTDYWTPVISDIKLFEKLLPDYLSKLPGAKPPTIAYGRQYVGIQIGKKLLIYGNFYPEQPGINQKQKDPVIVCDGGASFFGIVFDPQAQTFSDLSMNGVI